MVRHHHRQHRHVYRGHRERHTPPDAESVPPSKTFIPVPPEMTESVGCACNECAYMKLNILAKLYNALRYEWPEVVVDSELAEKASAPIRRMLSLSAQ